MGFQQERLVVIIGDPLIVPCDLFDTSSSCDDGRAQAVRFDATLDLTPGKDTIHQGTFARSRRAREGTAIAHARLVGDCIPTAVVGDTEVDLAGFDVAGPQELQ